MRCYQVLILFLIILQSCTKDPQYIDTTKESDALYIVESDTLQSAFVVYRLDSFQTSGFNRAIIGENTDPYFGIIKAKSFSRIQLATGNYLNIGSATESYDSIRLIMHMDHSYTGDTTIPWTASVHALTQDLDASAVSNSGTTAYYNHQQLSVSPAELGNTSVVIRPYADDSIIIKLDNGFGAELFNLYKTKNVTVSTQDAFQRYFKGICVQPGSSNNVIYGFNAADTGTVIRLYYHDDQGVHVARHLDFKSQGGNYQFSNIENDPTGTITEAVVKGHDTPSSALGHQIFVSDLAGVVTKFTLPSVKSLATLPDYVRLQSVQLKLRPVPTSYNKYPLIPYMGLGASNESSTSLTPLYTLDNSRVQNGNLFIDALKGVETGYTFDLSNLGRAEITSTSFTTSTVYLQPLSSGSSRLFTLSRLVAADNANPTSPSRVITQMLFFKK
ncbi:MAG: DUF4270 family protein [Chitinophagaceae bacterium]|nr:DUF4270 family protein [Chitinophagaceae bacterium]